jgi:hypothetical protein
MTDAALGMRAHSGWATLAVIAGPVRAPAVIERGRIDLVDSGVPGARQPYHAAAMEPGEAAAIVRRCTEEAERLALQALRATIKRLRAAGHDVVGCAILAGSGRPLTTLAQILASHALIHTAEGELFRNALRHAGERCELLITEVREHELYERAALQLGLSGDELRERMTEFGRTIGPPWRQDEKNAALAAWMALDGASRR